MSPESLPVKLRQLRGTMSLAEAAARAQIPEQRIRMYEEGVRQPYSKTLKRLAEAYGVPLSELTVNGGAPSPKAAPARTVRRRRRRRRAVFQNGERTVEVPVEVSPGERVRIVLELIVRPSAGQSTEAARPAATVALQTTDTAADDARGPSLLNRPQPLAASAAPRRSLHAPTGLASAFPERRRPQGHAADGADGGTTDLRDPLAEFRRAYGEFRRSRRS